MEVERPALQLPAALPIPELDLVWRQAIVGFLVEKTRRSGSHCTLEVYGRTIARFVEQVGHPSSARPIDVHRFAYGPGPRADSPTASTIAVRLAAVGGLYDFAVRMELVPRNPAANVQRPLVQNRPARALSDVEVRRLLAVIPARDAGLVDRAITVTALLTGLRRAELIGLHVIDPCPGEQPRYVARTKGGTIRTRELPRAAYDAICATETTLGRADGNPRRAFWISGATFYARLRRYGEEAGLGLITPHVLRHTAAKLRRQCGASIEAVSLLLGHRSIATTAVYLRQIESEHDDGWQAVATFIGQGSL